MSKHPTVPPSQLEEEYFLVEEAEKRRRLAQERVAKLAAEERERQRVAHFMKCPKCGMDLEEILFRGVKIDRCFHCHGTWLDAGELEQLAGAEGAGVLQAIVGLFRR
jgi:hypothetical protein